MTKDEVKVINNAFNILEKKNNIHNPWKNILLKDFDKNDFNCFLEDVLFDGLDSEKLKELKRSILTYKHNKFDPHVCIINDKKLFRIFVPEILTLYDALKNVHEITHGITLLNKENSDFRLLEEEIMPMNVEIKFIEYLNYNKEIILLDKFKKCLEACKNEKENDHYSMFQHAYATFINYEYSDDISLDLLYTDQPVFEYIKENNLILTNELNKKLREIS